jgi:catechol 2,3-dioxygenase-like lactoylglutathione lyase family enzyme
MFINRSSILFIIVISSIPPLSFHPSLFAQNNERIQKSNLAVYEGNFTGEILPIFYVRNLTASVLFYQKLGFRFDHYFDHHTGDSVTVWKYDDEPLYAEMWANNTRFALHTAKDPKSLVVGGMRHYFGVTDVNAHYEILKKNAIEVSGLTKRPWMRMFYVNDPDGHVIYFQTRPKEE